jgi:hypothetical protein
VFFNTEGSSEVSSEILVGSLAPFETKEGSFSLENPNFGEGSTIHVNGGIAVDNIPLSIYRNMTSISFESIENTALDTIVTLDDQKSGLIPNSLEPNENTFLEVSIKNSGITDANGVSIAITNLSGSQISLKEMNLSFDRIPKGATIKRRIQITGSSSIVSNQLKLGTKIVAREAVQPVFNEHSIQAFTGVITSQSPKNIGH